MEQIVYDSFELLLASSRASKSASLPNVECLPVRQFIATSKLSFNKYTVIVFAASAHVMNSKKRESILLSSAPHESLSLFPPTSLTLKSQSVKKPAFQLKQALPFYIYREKESGRGRENNARNLDFK